MPNASPDDPAVDTGAGPDPRGAPPGRRQDVRRVVVDPGGPVLVEGPVEVELPDGGTARSDRFMVAVCACRRSRDYPWCDTSHRRRSPAPGRPRDDAPARPAVPGRGGEERA